MISPLKSAVHPCHESATVLHENPGEQISEVHVHAPDFNLVVLAT